MTLNGAPVVMRSVRQKIVALSVTEAELTSRTQTVQETLHVMRLLESMDLLVENPMMLESYNKGAIDITNNWTANGRTKHIGNRCYFPRELKEQGVIESKWAPGVDNSADLFTKILSNLSFTKHAG